MLIASFQKARSLSEDLQTGQPINWAALQYCVGLVGKEVVLKAIEEEREGANEIFKAHLNLAEEAVREC